MTLLEELLNNLYSYGLSYYQNLVDSHTILAVSQFDIDTVEIEYKDGHGIHPLGEYCFISYGRLSGYHKITYTDTDIIRFKGIYYGEDIGDTIKFYKINEVLLNDILSRNKLLISNRIHIDLNEEKEILEYHNGSGTSELLLDRKHISSITSVSILNNPNTEYPLEINNIELISNQGILRLKNEVNNISFFPTGLNNILVKYNLGFTDETLPEDIRKALTLMSTSQLLSNEASFSGGGVSISVVSYSKTFGAKGEYSEIISQNYKLAKSLLAKYNTGIVGA